jgi:hypothetical protein
MLELRDLNRAETQIVYLTATLPPRDEVEFMQLMGLPSAVDKAEWRKFWFRSPTTRKNIRYQVVHYNAEEEDEAITRLVHRKSRQYLTKGQIIIYCAQVSVAQRLAEVLGCACYHRNVGSKEQKSEILQQFRSMVQPILTSTNALGLGLDIPTVRVVIHVGRVRNLREYVQESGRAGRDGLESEAMIMVGDRYDKRGRKVEVGRPGDVEEDMWEFMTTEKCRRIVLDRVMDGWEGRIRCEEGTEEQYCDSCRLVSDEEVEDEEGEDEEVEDEQEGLNDGIQAREIGQDAESIYSGVTDINEVGSDRRLEFEVALREVRELARAEKEYQMNKIYDSTLLEDVLMKWVEGCVWCHANDDDGYKGHNMRVCGLEGAEELEELIQVIGEKIVWQNYAGCWNCRVPQGICSGWIEKEDGHGYIRSGDECQYKGILVAAVVAIWHARRGDAGRWVLQQAAEAGIIMGVKDGEWSMNELMIWLGKKVIIGGIEGSNVCEILVRFGG